MSLINIPPDVLKVLEIQNQNIDVLASCLESAITNPQLLQTPEFRKKCLQLILVSKTLAPMNKDAVISQHIEIPPELIESLEKFTKSLHEKVFTERLALVGKRNGICDRYAFEYINGNPDSFVFSDETAEYISNKNGEVKYQITGVECNPDTPPAQFAIELLNLISISHQNMLKFIDENDFKVLQETDHHLVIQSKSNESGAAFPHWMHSFMRR